MNEIIQNLNDDQRIVCVSKDNLLITACPGSGKTRTIAHKIAYEVKSNPLGVKKILAITYTNKAADEIVDRLVTLGVEDERIWIGTIHQFCLDWILKRYRMYYKPLSSGFSIIDDFQKKRYLSEISQKTGISIGYGLNTSFSRLMTLNETRTDKTRLIKEYHNLLSKNLEIDFDLILAYSYKILHDNSFAASYIKNALDIVFIDEYQDTQELQYAIFEEIFNVDENCNTRICFFGDPNQAIYKSLGGVAKTIDDLNNEFKTINIKECFLQGCYRSSQRIVDQYSKFMNIKYQIRAIGKNKDQHGTLSYNQKINKTDIVNEISDLIRHHIEQGVNPNQICITAPIWSMLFPLVSSIKKKLPKVNFDAPDITPIKRNPLCVWYLVSKIIFSESNITYLRSKIRTANRINNILKDEYGLTVSGFSDIELINHINSLRENSLNDVNEDRKGYELVRIIMNSFIESLSDYDYKKSELLQSLERFLDNLSKRLEIPSLKMNDRIEDYQRMFRYRKGVVIESCHGIKGQEFEVVIAFGLLHGRIPYFDYVNTLDEIPEMNKMLYVIMSRAKNNLYLFSEKGRYYGGYHTEYRKSTALSKLIPSDFDYYVY